MSSDQLEFELRNIEQTLHAALVRQLRVISLMALLLGVAGFFVGLRRPTGLPSIKHFKQEITELSIGP